MKRIIIVTVIFLLCIAPFTLAEKLSPNEELLEEIDIMQAVLSRLIGNNTDGMPFMGSSAKGFYLSGYGVIFNVPYPSNYRISMFFAPPGPEETHDAAKTQIQRAGVMPLVPPVSDKDKKDPVPEIKKSLVEFFTKYASSISELKSDEKITVIVDLKGLPYMPSPQKDSSPRQITATMSAGDIADFKKGKMSVEGLGKRMALTEIESIDQDVSIFSNVIQTSLAHIRENTGLGFQGNVKSIHIKGIGIIFMVDADLGIQTFTLLNKNLGEQEKNLQTVDKKLERDNRTDNTKIVTKSVIASMPKDDDFKVYEEKLVKIISKYGQTLSKIKPEEYVDIALNFDGLGMNRKFSRGIIKVKKADIDDFDQGKIDFQNFRKKVSVVYY